MRALSIRLLPFIDFLLKWFLPLGFSLAILVALIWPEPGVILSSWEISNYKIVPTLNVMTIFLISGLELKTTDIKSAASKEVWIAFALGMIMILGITPLAGFVAVRIPFQVQEFKYGLAAFCSAPTTIASGVALVAQAGGNNVLALLLTVFSNLIGVATVPLWLKVIFASQDVNINAMDLFLKLVFTVLVPLVIGQLTRQTVPGIHTLVDHHETFLTIVSNTSLVAIVWQAISQSSNEILSVSMEALATVIAAGIGLHFAYLSLNYLTSKYVFRLNLSEQKAVVIMSSEKTLPVTVAVISFLTALGSEGFMTVPAIVSHVIQLFMDSFIAGRWEGYTTITPTTSSPDLERQ